MALSATLLELRSTGFLITFRNTASQTQDQMKGAFLLDVIVLKGTAVFQLLTSKDQALLIGRNTFLVLNLGLDVINRIGRLNIKGDGFSSKGPTKAIDQLKSDFLHIKRAKDSEAYLTKICMFHFSESWRLVNSL